MFGNTSGSKTLAFALAFTGCGAALAQDAPRLPLEQVPLNSVGTVSSVAIDRKGVIYVLQRGDKADPVIAVDPQGRVLRSWGKGMFTVPHSVRVDADGKVGSTEVHAGREKTSGDRCRRGGLRFRLRIPHVVRHHGCELRPGRTAFHFRWVWQRAYPRVHPRRKAGQGMGDQRERPRSVSDSSWNRIWRQRAVCGRSDQCADPALRPGRPLSGRMEPPRTAF